MESLHPTDRRPTSATLACGLVWSDPLADELRPVLAEHPQLAVHARCRLEAGAEHVEALLANDALTAVVLAVPVVAQYELALRCLRAGKHVLVHTPLATSSAHARALVDEAAACGLVLMGGLTMIYRRAVRRVRVLLERGELGATEAISVTHVRVDGAHRDPSVLWDLGPDEISRLRYWLGEAPASVRASSHRSAAEDLPDLAFVTLSFASGLAANLELSRTVPSRRRRTVLLGADRMLVFEDDAPDPVNVFDHGMAADDAGGAEPRGNHLFFRPPDVARQRPETRAPLALELDDFALAVDGGRPLWDPALAVDVVRTLEAAERSIAGGGTEVALEPADPAHDPPRTSSEAAP